jgi:hypothetical protein
MFQAFEVADYGLQIEMANEFRGEVLKCTHNQFAHHVLERCMECLPARRIKFIFKSFCSKAEEFSTTPYGCHIMQVRWYQNQINWYIYIFQLSLINNDTSIYWLARSFVHRKCWLCVMTRRSDTS